MKKLDFNNKWVLVTGASSGLGYEIATQLAVEAHANLFIVARRREKLEQLKQEIATKTDVQVVIIVADLSDNNAVDRVLDECLKDGKLYAAVLNAGITFFGRHTEMDWATFENMMQLNIACIVRMTGRITGFFEKEKKEGGIMLVSSMAATLPTPYQAAYSGTKGFLLNFAAALSQEIENPGFSLTVFMPAGIETEMTGGSEFQQLKSYLMPVKQAAKEGISGFRKRKLTCVPGNINRAAAFFSSFVPRTLILGQMKGIYRKALNLKS